jgi:hypothetical protein
MMIRAASAPAFGHPFAQDATQSTARIAIHGLEYICFTVFEVSKLPVCPQQ